MRWRAFCAAIAVFALILSGASAQPSNKGAKAEIERLNSQSLSLYQAGQFDQAMPLAQQALALSEQTYGTDHLGTVTSLDRLA